MRQNQWSNIRPELQRCVPSQESGLMPVWVPILTPIFWARTYYFPINVSMSPGQQFQNPICPPLTLLGYPVFDYSSDKWLSFGFIFTLKSVFSSLAQTKEVGPVPPNNPSHHDKGQKSFATTSRLISRYAYNRTYW